MAKTENNRIKAVAYLRTSSATNVGADKDSEKRQADAIASFASRSGFEIAETYSDPGVSGADPIETRPGFGAMLDRIEGNGVRTVIVEDASRFARDLMVQELGLLLLINRGVTVYASNGENLTETEDPMKRAMRQIAGVFAELEKHRLVAKLKAARDRKRRETGKCEGRKSHSEARPETVALAKRLHRKNSKTGGRRSLRGIAAALADAGHLNENEKPFAPKSVAAMLRR